MISSLTPALTRQRQVDLCRLAWSTQSSGTAKAKWRKLVWKKKNGGGVGLALRTTVPGLRGKKLRVILTAWSSLRDPTDPKSPTVEAGAPGRTPRHPDHSRISPLHKVGTFYKVYN